MAEDDVVLVAVVKDSPAEAAGMRIGDVLAEVDGQPTRGMEPFQVGTAWRLSRPSLSCFVNACNVNDPFSAPPPPDSAKRNPIDGCMRVVGG